MSKSVKNIIITFIIGCVVFVIGNFIWDGFAYKSTSEFLISFSIYQLYAFVLGYSQMYFFEYFNNLNWKEGDTLKRIIIGVLISTIITVFGLFLLRMITAVGVEGISFKAFFENESFANYQFGIWITLSIVITFHIIYFYNKYQQNKIKEQKVIAGTASAKFDALKNQLDPHFLFNSLNVLTSLIEENPVNAQKFTTSLSKVYRYVLEQKNKELEGIVAERTKEISHQRDEILEQKTEIEDSINYAVRIQEAMLPFQEDIFKSFPEHFVLFKPKDVVSGDFYWHTVKGSHHILVCADCTGHGVPGAFMSMVGSDKLSHAVSEYGLTMPNDLLSFVNQGIKTALKQDETSENATRDGMDVAIITYDSAENKLYYAGAHRSLMILENEEVSEIKATKVAVGGFTPMDQEFALHEVEITPNRTFFMTTDGYADQFGGERGKKLKIKAMKKVMIENGNKPMIDQKEALDKTIEDWMVGHEQIDDICVIGVRFKD